MLRETREEALFEGMIDGPGEKIEFGAQQDRPAPHEDARGAFLQPFAFTSGHLCSNFFREVGHVTLRN